MNKCQSVNLVCKSGEDKTESEVEEKKSDELLSA